MNDMIIWIAAEAKRRGAEGDVPIGNLPAHLFGGRKAEDKKPERVSDEAVAKEIPHFSQNTREMGHPPLEEQRTASEDAHEEEDRQRRIYRKRTVAMLRRYMRYSIETGRLPSLLGREFFRSKVTSYTVVTFEDRVIFVHDMEKCLDRLNEFSRQLIARHILQEHDRWATARLLQCNEKTVRRLTPLALDLMSEILLDVGLLKRVDANPAKFLSRGYGEGIVRKWL